MAITPFLLGCSTGGRGAQPLWDMFLIPASSLQLVWTLIAQSGAWGPPLLGAGFLYRILSPTDWLPVFTRLYNCSTFTFFLWASQIALNSTHPRSRLYPDIPRPDAPVIYTGAFPILTAWPESICYTYIVPFTFLHMLIPSANRVIVFLKKLSSTDRLFRCMGTHQCS